MLLENLKFLSCFKVPFRYQDQTGNVSAQLWSCFTKRDFQQSFLGSVFWCPKGIQMLSQFIGNMHFNWKSIVYVHPPSLNNRPEQKTRTLLCNLLLVTVNRLKGTNCLHRLKKPPVFSTDWTRKVIHSTERPVFELDRVMGGCWRDHRQCLLQGVLGVSPCCATQTSRQTAPVAGCVWTHLDKICGKKQESLTNHHREQVPP